MPTYTPNYNFALPLVNNATDQDLWGGYLNSNFTLLDTLLQKVQPSGEIKFFPTTAAPTGYLEANGALISRTTYPNLYAFALASGNIASVDTTTINNGIVFNPGVGYVAGTYTNVSLTGGSGSGAVATIVVNGSGNVSSVALTTNPSLAPGSSYVVGDYLSCANSSIGGSGYGFSYQVQSVTGWDKGMFSPGDGSTTFRIPDMRRAFLRGYDDALDSRAIGTTQPDTVGPHNHGVTDPEHFHDMQNLDIFSGVGSGSIGNPLAVQYGNGSSNPTLYASTGISVNFSNGVESRPYNICGMFCIKT